jgi:tRNA(Ile2) C34 agmatinyltransferase TiaS
MSNKFQVVHLFNKIDTVHGICEHCEEESVLVAIVPEYYRCTNCGEDTRQHINGSIRYLKLSKDDKEWLKNQKVSE